MGDIKYLGALLLIICVDVILLLGQLSISTINPESSASFINYNASMFKSYDSGGYILNTSQVNDLIPGGDQPITEGSSGDIFSDTFRIMNTWIFSGKIFEVVLTTLAGPYTYLANPVLGLPAWFSMIVGGAWIIITFFLLAVLILGR